MDTLFSMLIGWAINSAMILVAVATFFTQGIQVNELGQAQQLLKPLLGVLHLSFLQLHYSLLELLPL